MDLLVELLVDLLADLLVAAAAEAVTLAVTITTIMLVGRQTTTTTVSLLPSPDIFIYMSCIQSALCKALASIPRYGDASRSDAYRR